MAARQTSFLSLLNALKRGLQETQEMTATVSVPAPQEQRRRHKRYKFKWVRAELKRPAVPALSCYLEDLSETGCRLVIEPKEDLELQAWKADIARAQTLEIVFQQAKEEELRVLALVRHVSDGFLGSLVLGIEFCALSEALRHELASVLKLLTGQAPATRSTAELAALSAGPAKSLVAPAKLLSACRGKELGEVLALMGALSAEEVGVAVEEARKRAQQLDSYLVEEQLATDVQLCQAFSLQSGLPVNSLAGVTVTPRLTKFFSRLTLMRLRIVPFDLRGDSLCLAAVRPLSGEQLRDLTKSSGMALQVYLAPESRIRELLGQMDAKRRKERRFTRIRSALPVTFTFCASDGTPLSDSVYSGTALDISEGGFRIEGSAPAEGSPEELVKHGAMLQVVFCGQTQPISVVCHVRSVVSAPQSPGTRPNWIFGLQVAQVAEKDLCALREICIRTGMATMCGHAVTKHAGEKKGQF